MRGCVGPLNLRGLGARGAVSSRVESIPAGAGNGASEFGATAADDEDGFAGPGAPSGVEDAGEGESVVVEDTADCPVTMAEAGAVSAVVLDTGSAPVGAGEVAFAALASAAPRAAEALSPGARAEASESLGADTAAVESLIVRADMVESARKGGSGSVSPVIVMSGG